MWKILSLCFVLITALLTACTASHTQQTLTEAQQRVGLKNNNQIKRWYNIQLHREHAVLIYDTSNNPQLQPYAEAIYQQLLLQCEKYFAKCLVDKTKRAAYVLELKVLDVVLSTSKPESNKAVQVKSLDWVLSIRDGRSQQLIEKVNVLTQKSMIHRDGFAIADLLKPSVIAVYEELTSEQ